MQLMFQEIKDLPKDTTKQRQQYKKYYQMRKWRKKLQEYCDNQAYGTEYKCDSWCVCGYMSYCDYCSGNFAREQCCAKAICQRAKELGIKIDYNDFNFVKLLHQLGDKRNEI